MSKRRNRKSTPNIPQDILERARQQIAQQDTASAESGESVEEASEEVSTGISKPVASATKVNRAERAQPQKPRPRRREGIQPARFGEKKIDPNDPETVQQLLANPTKVVTEDELRREYGYVLSDLRSMGLLAAGLVVALVIIAQLL
jgi:hypothetical protein